MHACVCERDVFAIDDNNILLRLIMIIIKIIFLDLIDIAHTDDSHPHGYPVSTYNYDFSQCV